MTLFAKQEGVRSYTKFRCRVVSAWSTRYPALLAYAVPKRSPLFPFLFHAFLELLENGCGNHRNIANLYNTE